MRNHVENSELVKRKCFCSASGWSAMMIIGAMLSLRICRHMVFAYGRRSRRDEATDHGGQGIVVGPASVD